MTAGSVTTTFTIEEINRMKEGINQGLLYNTQGLPAQQGEELMTLDMLNNYAADLNFKGKVVVFRSAV